MKLYFSTQVFIILDTEKLLVEMVFKIFVSKEETMLAGRLGMGSQSALQLNFVKAPLFSMENKQIMQ